MRQVRFLKPKVERALNTDLLPRTENAVLFLIFMVMNYLFL